MIDMSNVPRVWPADRIGDDKAVEDRIVQVRREEMERCATAAADACLDQDEAGHSGNSDTWLAACIYIKSKIMSVKPDWQTTPADLVREEAVAEMKERCAKVAEDTRGWAGASDAIAAQIRDVK